MSWEISSDHLIRYSSPHLDTLLTHKFTTNPHYSRPKAQLNNWAPPPIKITYIDHHPNNPKYLPLSKSHAQIITQTTPSGQNPKIGLPYPIENHHIITTNKNIQNLHAFTNFSHLHHWATQAYLIVRKPSP